MASGTMLEQLIAGIIKDHSQKKVTPRTDSNPQAGKQYAGAPIATSPSDASTSPTDTAVSANAQPPVDTNFLQQILGGNNSTDNSRQIAKAMLDTSQSNALRQQAMDIMSQANAQPHAKVTGSPNIWSLLLAAAPAALTGNSKYIAPLLQGYQQGQDRELASREQLRNQQIAMAGQQAQGLNTAADRAHQDELAMFSQDSQNSRNDADNARMIKTQEIGNKIKQTGALAKSFENTIKESIKIHDDFVKNNGREMNEEEQKAFADGNIRTAVQHYNDQYKALTGEDLGLNPDTYVNMLMSAAKMNPGKITAKQANTDRRFTFQVDKEKWSQGFKTKSLAEKKREFDTHFDEQKRQFEKTYGRMMTAQEATEAYREASLGFRGTALDIQGANADKRETPEAKEARSEAEKAYDKWNDAYVRSQSAVGKDEDTTKALRQQAITESNLYEKQYKKAKARLESLAGSGASQSPKVSTGGRAPAAIRYNNPGAMWDNPIAKEFGSVGKKVLNDGLGQGNQIAIFPNPVDGAAAQFALLSRKYTGQPLSAVINRWSGGNNVQGYLSNIQRRTGISPNTLITKDFLKTQQGVDLVAAMAAHESGKEYPLTNEQWRDAQTRGTDSKMVAAKTVSKPKATNVIKVSGGRDIIVK